MKFSLTQPDPVVPRTVFYERLREALGRNSRFLSDESQADLLIPAEDTALETNWPRYGNPGSAFIRGGFDERIYRDYLERLARMVAGKPLCIISMNPFAQLPLVFANHAHIIIAELSLSSVQRAVNPRTISMPALPIIVPAVHFQAQSQARSVLASFRGAASHPVRQRLADLHNGRQIVVELIDPSNHKNRIDATNQQQGGGGDPAYADLLGRSVFSFVPRGDALFSYRLLEAMAFGSIPVILSDGWVLPFHRQIDWTGVALVFPEGQVEALPQILGQFSAQRIGQMQMQVGQIYARHFASLDAICESMLREAEMLMGR